MIAWLPFYNPMPIDGANWPLWLLLPILAAVAVVYKTIRTEDIRRLPLEIAMLIGYMISGLILLGAALWLVYVMFA